MIEFNQVTKRFGQHVAVSDLSLHIPEGAFSILIGGSGSGKSTTLKLINRLHDADSGHIRFRGERIDTYHPDLLRRKIGYAIQSVGLFPHYTVEENIAVVPKLLKWKPAVIQQRIDELLDMLALDPSIFRQRYPHQLSGGQQQRVGVARALAADPDVLLMDEPFGALDPVIRLSLQDEIRTLHQKLGKTIVMVTHDMDEALKLGSQINLFDHGKLIQSGSPLEILTRPANQLVSDFIGQAELGLHQLGLLKVKDRISDALTGSAPSVHAETSLKEALSLLVSHQVQTLHVVNEEGHHVGNLNLKDLVPSEALA